MWKMLCEVMPRCLSMWTSLMSLAYGREDYAVLLLWTESSGPLLALITEPIEPTVTSNTPKFAAVVTPSSYLDKPGEWFMLCTQSEKGGNYFRKVGIGVNSRVHAKSTQILIVENGI